MSESGPRHMLQRLVHYVRRAFEITRQSGLQAAARAAYLKLHPGPEPPYSAALVAHWLAYYRQRTELTRQDPASISSRKNARVSIILLTYNNLELTELCLRSIYCNTSYPDFEVIVVDNASGDGTPAWLQGFAAAHNDMRLILNSKNRGFAAGNNQGAHAATGEYLVFLNNDTVVTRGWIEGLMAHLQSDPRIGLVGPVTNGTGNEARIPTHYMAASEMEVFAAKRAKSMTGQAFDIRSLALFCVIARRAEYESVGELDERFGRGMFEDEDLAVRYQQRGLRVICAEDVFIHHFWRAAFGRLEKRRYDRLFTENRRKFEAKWGRAWQPYETRRVLRASPRTGALTDEPTLRDVLSYRCNICGRSCQTSLADLGRELRSCTCGATVRARAIIHVLSCELFGRSLPLAEFPVRPGLRGWGMSDPAYADILSTKFDFVNTFYDREPRFDITAPLSPDQEGSLDFLISSEVFEHVAPPVSIGFENARRLLKPGGVLVLTVPYSLQPETNEHFPELYQYELIQEPGAPPRLRNVTRDGREQFFDDLLFHEGLGAVLEMRMFSQGGLLRDLREAGFGDVRIYSEPHWEFGIYWRLPHSLPIAARLTPKVPGS